MNICKETFVLQVKVCKRILVLKIKIISKEIPVLKSKYITKKSNFRNVETESLKS